MRFALPDNTAVIFLDPDNPEGKKYRCFRVTGESAVVIKGSDGTRVEFVSLASADLNRALPQPQKQFLQ